MGPTVHTLQHCFCNAKAGREAVMGSKSKYDGGDDTDDVEILFWRERS